MRKTFVFVLSSVLLMQMNAPTFSKEVNPENWCKKLINCVTEKLETILKELGPNPIFHHMNPKLVHTLAKQCKTTTDDIRFILGLLQNELAIRPENFSVQNYLSKRIKEPLENKKVYEETIPLENEEYKVKLYVINYSPALSSNPVQVDSELYINDPDLKAEWQKLSGRDKPMSWWFSHDTISYSFSFEIRGASGKIHPTPPAKGFLIFERPLDYHLITKECVSED